jgi:hypothetical protein
LSNEKPNLLDPSYLELAFGTGQQPPESASKLGAKLKPQMPISWPEIWRETVLQHKTRADNHHAM